MTLKKPDILCTLLRHGIGGVSIELCKIIISLVKNFILVLLYRNYNSSLNCFQKKKILANDLWNFNIVGKVYVVILYISGLNIEN